MKKNKFIIGGFLITAVFLAGCSEISNPVEDAKQQVEDKVKEKVTETVNETTDIALNAIQAEIQSTIDFENLFPDPQIRTYAEKWIGLEAPEFSLTSVDGQMVSLKDYKGKDIILELASTTCGACIATQPLINEFSKNNPETLVLQVFAEDKTAVESFMKDTNSTNVGTAMPNGKTAVFDSYELAFTPTTIFIDQDGIIQFTHIGSYPDTETIELYKQLAFE